MNFKNSQLSESHQTIFAKKPALTSNIKQATMNNNGTHPTTCTRGYAPHEPGGSFIHTTSNIQLTVSWKTAEKIPAPALMATRSRLKRSLCSALTFRTSECARQAAYPADKCVKDAPHADSPCPSSGPALPVLQTENSGVEKWFIERSALIEKSLNIENCLVPNIIDAKKLRLTCSITHRVSQIFRDIDFFLYFRL